MDNNYCMHCSMDCKDNKTHRLSYDIISSRLGTEGLGEISGMFDAIAKYIPGFNFCITKDSEIIYESSKENITQRENSETN